MTDVLFAGIRLPVRFLQCPVLFGQALDFFHAWPFEIIQDPTVACSVQMTASGQEATGYDISAPWLNSPLHEPTLTSALCSLAIELVAAFCKEHDMLCLHAAAMGFQEEHTLLLGGNHAGKSTLIARLMADGCTSYGDDLIGITARGDIFSFGIAPRLRLPLPPSSPLLDFLLQHKGIGDDRYQYIKADSPLVAPFGHTAVLTRIVMLQRRSDGPAEFIPLTQASGLQGLLPHYVMQRGTAEAVFRQASAIMQHIPAGCFRYASLDEAASLLKQFPAEPHAAPPAATVSPSYRCRTRRLRAIRSRAIKPRPRALQCYVQAPGVQAFSEYGSFFLTDSSSDAVFGLNRPGELLWNMLKQPLCEQEASLLLQEAFPSISRSRIQRDVEELFSRLKHKKLIVPCRDTED